MGGNPRCPGAGVCDSAGDGLRVVAVAFEPERYEKLAHEAARRQGFRPGVSWRCGMEYEDAVQAARIGIWKAWDTFDPGKVEEKYKDPFAAYALTRAGYEILEEARRGQWVKAERYYERKGRHLRIDHIDESGYDQVGPEKTALSAEECAMWLEWLERAEQAVHELSAECRHIYQGVMLQDQAGGQGNGASERLKTELGWTAPRLSKRRAGIRDAIMDLVGDVFP